MLYAIVCYLCVVGLLGVVRRGGVKNINIMNSIASAVYMYFQIFPSVKPTDTRPFILLIYNLLFCLSHIYQTTLLLPFISNILDSIGPNVILNAGGRLFLSSSTLDILILCCNILLLLPFFLEEDLRLKLLLIEASD